MNKLRMLWTISLLVSCNESYKYSLHQNNDGVHLCAMLPANKSISSVRTVINCAGQCSQDTNCGRFNYRRFDRICQLFYNPYDYLIDYAIDDAGCSHYKKISDQESFSFDQHPSVTPQPFQAESTRTNLSPMNTKSIIIYATTSASQSMETSNSPQHSVSSATRITSNKPTTTSSPQNEPIRMQQNNRNNSTAFVRSWQEFKKGFEDSSGNFWIGNDALHNLTSRSACQLLIKLFSTSSVYMATYGNPFQVGDEASQYLLSIAYGSGNASGDGMTKQNQQKFSSYDNDNDQDTNTNCASSYDSGWWFGSTNIPPGSNKCGKTNLNSYSAFKWDQMPTGIIGSQMWIVC